MEPDSYKLRKQEEYQKFLNSGQLEKDGIDPEKIAKFLRDNGYKVEINMKDRYSAIVIARILKRQSKGKRITRIRSELTIQFDSNKTKDEVDEYWDEIKNLYPNFVLDAYIPVSWKGNSCH